MKIYAYILSHDTGFAPCYTDGIWTLACCKPQIRAKIFNEHVETGQNEFWVIGLQHEGSMQKDYTYPGVKVRYIACAKVLRLEEYYKDDGPYSNRIDCIYRNVTSLDRAKRRTYEELKEHNGGKVRQVPTAVEHRMENDDEKMSQTARDIYGNCVLISNEFYCLPDEVNVNAEGILYDKLYEMGKNRRTGKYEIEIEEEEFLQGIAMIKEKGTKRVPIREYKRCKGGCVHSKKTC